MQEDAGPSDGMAERRWTLAMSACGVAATTVASAALMAALRDKSVVPLAVFAGATAIVLAYYWHWRRILFRPEMRLAPGDARRRDVAVVAAIFLVMGLAWELVVGLVTILAARNERGQPCLCAHRAGLHVWLDLSGDTVIFTFLAACGLLLMAFAAYQLAYRLKR